MDPRDVGNCLIRNGTKLTREADRGQKVSSVVSEMTGAGEGSRTLHLHDGNVALYR